MWCNAQILLDGLFFHFTKLKRFVGLDGKKNIHIFVVRMFEVYVEASIGSYWFILAQHRMRNSFSIFHFQCGKALKMASLMLKQFIGISV